MALDIEDPSSFEPNLRTTLAAFDAIAWPIFERWRFSRDAALIAFYLSAAAGAMLDLRDAIDGIDDDPREPWEG